MSDRTVNFGKFIPPADERRANFLNYNFVEEWLVKKYI